MQPNRVKAALKAGQTVVGPIIGEARSFGTIKLMANAGHDFLFLDMEHAMFDWETMVNLVQAARLVGIAPILRVTDLSYPLVARALDSGAAGVIIPRVETKEQVEQAVYFAKYPPIGRRGAGGEARNGYDRVGVKEAIDHANEETLVIVQVESTKAVEIIDDIASVPHLDVVLIGPQDLSISLGLHGQFGHPDFVATLQKVADACAKHGVATGMVERNAEDQRRWHAMGMRFLCTNTDSNLLYQGAAKDVEITRGF